MLLDEYDYDMDIAVKTAEAKEEGTQNGRMLERFANLDSLTRRMNITLDQAINGLGFTDDDKKAYLEWKNASLS